jgi:hypothetical protein
LNAGAFNLGAGLSFAVLYAVMTQINGGTGTASYVISVAVGGVLVVAALLCSFLIPKVEESSAAGEVSAA